MYLFITVLYFLCPDSIFMGPVSQVVLCEFKNGKCVLWLFGCVLHQDLFLFFFVCVCVCFCESDEYSVLAGGFQTTWQVYGKACSYAYTAVTFRQLFTNFVLRIRSCISNKEKPLTVGVTSFCERLPRENL